MVDNVSARKECLIHSRSVAVVLEVAININARNARVNYATANARLDVGNVYEQKKVVPVRAED
jgi:hypothetical protein